MKKLVLLFAVISAFCKAQAPYYYFSSSIVSVTPSHTVASPAISCSGDSVKVDFTWQWEYPQTSTTTATTWFALKNSAGTDTIWHGLISKILSLPQETIVIAPDTILCFYMYIHIPANYVASTATLQTPMHSPGSSVEIRNYYPINTQTNPVISVTTHSFCAGAQYTFDPAGATTYSYSTGSQVIVQPQTNITYSVTGYDIYGCNSTITVQLTQVTCDVGIEEYQLNSNTITPTYYDMNGIQVEKESRKVLIERIGTHHKLVMFE